MAFITATGTITRVFFEGKGAELTETFEKRDGSEGKKRYTLWFKEPHGLREGDTGSYRGALSVDVDEWTDKEGTIRHTAKVSVNGAQQNAPGAAPYPANDATEASTGTTGPSDSYNASAGGFEFESPTPF